MPKQLLNEPERFLIERWEEASRLEQSMESVREKYEELFERVTDAVTKRHPEFNDCKVNMTQKWSDGEIGFGRESWPGKDGPSGLWMVNLKLERLANSDSADPYACVWIRGDSKIDLESAANILKEEAKKIITSEQLKRFESKWNNLWILPAPSKKEMLTAFSSSDGEEFVELLVKQFDQMARFVPVLDKIFSDYYSKEFNRLSAQWHKDTDHLSSTSKSNAHPAYLEIIALGQGVVPFLLRDLEKNRAHWFKALEAITGTHPLSPSIAGQIPKMAQAWLSWAKENGYHW